MKTILTTVLIESLTIALIYLSISFFNLELNPLKWSEESRISFFGLAFISLLFSPGLYLAIKD